MLLWFVDFFIDKSVFGTPFNIFCNDNGEITKSDMEYVDDGSIININSKDAWLMSKIYGFQIPRFPTKKYVNSIEAVLPKEYKGTNDIQWSSVMPDNVYKKEVKRFINKSKDIFCNNDFKYYREIYRKQNILFHSLNTIF